MSRVVLVLAEIRNEDLRNVTFEALSAARLVADGGEIIAAAFGSSSSRYVSLLTQFGADKVFTLSDERLNQYTPDAYVQAFTQLVRETNPDVIFIGHTAIGKDLAPRAAARLGIGLISDVTHV